MTLEFPDPKRPDLEAPLAVWEYAFSLERQLRAAKKALVRCVIASGSDMGGGIPKWPPLDEWAVREVTQLRTDYDEALEALRKGAPSGR